MRPPVAALATILLAAKADAQPARRQFAVSAPGGPVTVESFGHCARPTCRAVIVLSGSRGFASPAYGDIGRTFQAAGLDAYLVHVLSATDLETITSAKDARARVAYYARRLPDWTSTVRSVIADLGAQQDHAGKVGILGISLGAEIASAASIARNDVGALVLVDGGFPAGDPRLVRPLPPLLLIWGSSDRTFPLAVGRDLEKRAQGLGGSVSLKVYEGGPHDFFLQAGNQAADAAHRNAADFLASRLSP